MEPKDNKAETDKLKAEEEKLCIEAGLIAFRIRIIAGQATELNKENAQLSNRLQVLQEQLTRLKKE